MALGGGHLVADKLLGLSMLSVLGLLIKSTPCPSLLAPKSLDEKNLNAKGE